MRADYAFGALLAVVVLAGPAAGVAQSDDEGDQPTEMSELSDEKRDDYKEFVKAGKDAYQAGEYTKAIPFLQKAYDILPKPLLKYRLAQAYAKSDQLEKALEAYRTFLEKKPESERRGKVEKSIEELEKKLEEQSRAELTIESTPSGAKVFFKPADADKIEDSSRGRTPLELSTEPGDVKILLEKEGHEARTETVTLEGGTSKTYSYELTSSTTKEGGGSGGGIGTGATVGLVIGSIGVVGGGTFYGLGTYCGNSSTGNKRNCTRELHNLSVISSYVGGGLGVIGLGMSTIFLLTQGGGESQAGLLDDVMPVRVHVSPRGIGVSGRF